MSKAFTKLFSSIISSSIWRSPKETKIVWITMLAMADKDGEVWASVGGLADMARISRGECQLALAELLSPDEDSRTKDFDGRRVEPIDGGWKILNYQKYRDLGRGEDRRDYMAKHMREKRAPVSNVSNVSNVSSSVSNVSTLLAPTANRMQMSPIAEAEAEAEAERERETRAPAPVSISDGIQKPNREESAFVDFLKDLGCLVERDGESIVTEWKAAVKGLKVKRVREMLEQARPGILWPSELRRARVSAGT